jgi:hypothetical protein
MTTRSIVTSQPDVACDVCMRRLLRGEQPDVFLASGQRLLVCELCAPRATHEGWLRERDAQAATLPPARPRRGRGLLARLKIRTPPARPAQLVSAVEPSNPHGQAVIEEFEAVELQPLAAEPAAPEPSEPIAFVPAQALSADVEMGASESGIAAPARFLAEDPRERVALAQDGPAEEESSDEGSWRDAWMFVTE